MSLFLISPPDLAATYRALGALYNAGVGPSHSFSFIVESTECRPLKRALKQLSEATANGTPVSVATAAFPRIFPTLHRNIIAAGEASGLMPAALSGLAQMVERDHALRESIKRELTPVKINLAVFVPVLVFILGSGLIGWGGMSIRARLLISLFSVCTIVLFAAAILLVQINNEAELRYGAVVHRVPAIGEVARLMSENHFTRVLAVCQEAGILPLGSVTMAAEACGSPSMSIKLMGALPCVRDGMTMAASLENTECLSDYLISMLEVGEESGKVVDVLYKAQDHQAEVIANSLQQLKSYVTTLSNIAVVGLCGTIILILYGVL